MKLVCCCGASIEFSDDRLSYQCGTQQITDFRSDHAVCRVPKKVEAGDVTTFAPEEWSPDRAKMRDRIVESIRTFPRGIILWSDGTHGKFTAADLLYAMGVRDA